MSDELDLDGTQVPTEEHSKESDVQDNLSKGEVQGQIDPQDEFDKAMDEIFSESESETTVDDTEEADEEETESQSKEESQDVLTISDKLVEQYPALSGLKGKGIEDLAKSYTEVQKWATKLSMENKTLKAQKVETVKEQKQTEELIKDFPDLSELTPEEQQKAIMQIVQSALKGVKTEVPAELREIAEEREAKQLIDTISASVLNGVREINPEIKDYDFNEVFSEWRKSVGMINPDGSVNDDVVEKYNKKDSDTAIGEIVLFAQRKVFSEMRKAKDAEKKTKIYDKTVSTLKKAADNVQPVKSVAHKRETDKLTAEDQFAKELADSIQSNFV